MSLDAAALERLRDALAAALAVDDGGDPDVAEEIARVQDHLAVVVGTTPILPAPTGHPLTAHLALAIEATAARFPGLAAALHPLFADLPWRYGYTARADLPGLENRMGWAEIVGPAAPFRSASVCLGLTFLASGTRYPDHRHPAVEFYRIVAGHPLWTVESQTRRLASPAAVLHVSGARHAMASGARHAMASGGEALLAIYSWTGDIVSPSVWSEPAAPGI
jgi:hypothetical protein